MIFAFPTSGRGIERAQLFAPPDFALRDLGQEGAALSLAEQLVDIGEQSFRERDMGAFLGHLYIPLVNGQVTLHEPRPSVNGKTRHTPPAHPPITTHNLFYGVSHSPVTKP